MVMFADLSHRNISGMDPCLGGVDSLIINLQYNYIITIHSRRLNRCPGRMVSRTSFSFKIYSNPAPKSFDMAWAHVRRHSIAGRCISVGRAQVRRSHWHHEHAQSAAEASRTSDRHLAGGRSRMGRERGVFFPEGDEAQILCWVKNGEFRRTWQEKDANIGTPTVFLWLEQSECIGWNAQKRTAHCEC